MRLCVKLYAERDNDSVVLYFVLFAFSVLYLVTVACHLSF